MKTQPNESVLHDWVTGLPFMQQALLMLATRGPDGLQKHTPAKRILHYLRGVVIKPAHKDFYRNDSFMSVDYGDIVYERDHWGNDTETIERPWGWEFKEAIEKLMSDVDSYPLHFYLHLFHASEVVGYKHPDPNIREAWRDLYWEMCDGMHVHPETCCELDKRLKW